MKLTEKVIIGAVVSLVAYDVWAAFLNKTQGDTISEVMLDTSRRYPVVSFGLGFLCGHLVWSQRAAQAQATAAQLAERLQSADESVATGAA